MYLLKKVKYIQRSLKNYQAGMEVEIHALYIGLKNMILKLEDLIPPHVAEFIRYYVVHQSLYILFCFFFH